MVKYQKHIFITEGQNPSNWSFQLYQLENEIHCYWDDGNVETQAIHPWETPSEVALNWKNQLEA